jgi:hypothetical protein
MVGIGSNQGYEKTTILGGVQEEFGEDGEVINSGYRCIMKGKD